MPPSPINGRCRPLSAAGPSHKRKSPSCSLRCAQVSSTNRSVVVEAKAEHWRRLQGAFEDELEVALRSLRRRAICTMSIPATSTNAT
jgi:hypothetical protein